MICGSGRLARGVQMNQTQQQIRVQFDNLPYPDRTYFYQTPDFNPKSIYETKTIYCDILFLLVTKITSRNKWSNLKQKFNGLYFNSFTWRPKDIKLQRSITIEILWCNSYLGEETVLACQPFPCP